MERWINKTSGKTKLSILKATNGTDLLISETGYYGFKGILDLKILFPWAEFSIDEEYYEEQEQDEFIAEYGIWDSEEKTYVGTREDFYEHRARWDKIRHLEDGTGEIHYYRLFIGLNKLGKSFLEVNDFMEFGVQLKLFDE